MDSEAHTLQSKLSQSQHSFAKQAVDEDYGAFFPRGIIFIQVLDMNGN